MARPYRTRDDERDVFRALAHPIRRKILAESIRQVRSFEELRQLAKRGDATVAGHLRILRDAGLLAVTRHGRSMAYQANQSALRAAARWMSGIAASSAGE